MDLNDFSFRVLLLGIPGFVGYFVLRQILGLRHHGPFESVLLIVLVGFFAYVGQSCCVAALDLVLGAGGTVTPVEALFSAVPGLGPWEVVGASGMAVAGAYGLAFGLQRRLPERLAFRAGIVNANPHRGLWDYFFNRDVQEGPDDWVYVRDLRAGVIYFGFAVAWSEREGNREILLENATVFSADDGAELYSVRLILVARAADDLTVEVDVEAAASGSAGGAPPHA